MKVILSHKTRVLTAENIIANMNMIKSYLDVKNLQKYIDFEDIITQLHDSIKASQELYNELVVLYKQFKRKL